MNKDINLEYKLRCSLKNKHIYPCIFPFAYYSMNGQGSTILQIRKMRLSHLLAMGHNSPITQGICTC